MLALGFDEAFIRKWDYYFHYCEVRLAFISPQHSPSFHPLPFSRPLPSTPPYAPFSTTPSSILPCFRTPQVGFKMRVLGDLQIVYSKAANLDLHAPLEALLCARSRGLEHFIETNLTPAARNGH